VVGRGGSRVRELEAPAVLRLSGGRVFARVPTELERREFGIREGVAVLVVRREGEDEEVYGGDGVVVEVVGVVCQCRV
jgi:hypothetical protein